MESASCEHVQPNSPIRFFLIFHRSIGNQLDELQRLAISTQRNNVDIIQYSSVEQYKFLGFVYNLHLKAKYEVIFSALKIARGKNLVGGYLGQRDLSDQISEIQNSTTLMNNEIGGLDDFLSLTKALKQLIIQDMAKEEKEVLPMLIINFSIEEQASLVRRYLHEIPTYLLAKLLSCLSTSLSTSEYQDVLKCLETIIIIPEDKLLQQVIFNWIERKESHESHNESTSDPMEKTAYERGRVVLHPIDDTLLWHKAIKKELNEIFEKIKRMYLSGDFTSRQDFNQRFKFITEICLFYSFGRDKVIFPSVYGEVSSFHQHDEQQSKFDEFHNLIKNTKEEANSSAEFYSKLCSSVDRIMGTVNRHFYIEESQVLPLAREKFSIERQRALLHQTLCMMPLRSIKLVLPWLVRTMNDNEARDFLDNLKRAGPPSDSSLVKLFCSWAFINEASVGCIEQPIDVIFSVHRAIRRDLEYLSVESGRIKDGDEAFLHRFIGRFCLFWGLYKSHSNSKDNVIYPAIESKEEFRNLTCSYAVDHAREERLFEEIFRLLSELSQIRQAGSYVITSEYCDLSSKLQVMCESIRMAIDQHSFREENELWPLLRRRFLAEEQDKMIGYVLGTTTAEILRLLLPWVTSSLTREEHSKMMAILKRVTKNTMFDEWLSDCSKENYTCAFESGSFQESKARSDQIFRPRKKDRKDVLLDPTSGSMKKKKLLKKYMASRWMAAQKRLPRTRESLIGRSASFQDPEGKKFFGCDHYKRNCKLRATCCGELFTCRFCHDTTSDHSMDRKSTSEMMCMQCLEIQPIGPTCNTPSCNGFPMAKYFCNICKLFDDERNIYHCPYCNICRVGSGLGVDYFHCMSCNCCMALKLLDHECKQKKCLETSCPVCDEFLFTSVKPVKSMRCGHCIHSTCFKECKSSPCKCLICSNSSVATMIKPYNHIENGRQHTEAPSRTGDTSKKRVVFGFARFWAERLSPFLSWLQNSSLNRGRVRTIGKEIRRAEESLLVCCFALCFLAVLFCVMTSLAVLLCLKVVGADKYVFRR